MFFLRRPTSSTIAQLHASQRGARPDYPDVGLTRDGPDAVRAGLDGRWKVDHNRAVIGAGAEDFARGRELLRAWTMFDIGWVEVMDFGAPIEVGTTAGVIARALGLWTLNFARIQYVIDEPERFGFAYGTLPQHVETGEERFLVEWDPGTGEVSFELLAFSRPSHILARLGFPVTRHLQKKFATDAKARMRRGVAGRDGA